MDTKEVDAESSSEFPIDLGTLSNDLGLGIKVVSISSEKTIHICIFLPSKGI